MNLLASPLPATVRIGEAGVALRTGYRTGIQVARAADSGLPDAIIAGTIVRLYFGDNVPTDTGAALEAAMRFHRCDEPIPERSRRTPKRLLDWDHDAGMILADFRREYSIDLADPQTRMHWWVFMAYFRNLSGASETKTAMYYRGSTKPRGMSGDEARRWNEMKRAYALPPRTVVEAEKREAEMWGD